jgi:hypothetical protein
MDTAINAVKERMKAGQEETKATVWSIWSELVATINSWVEFILKSVDKQTVTVQTCYIFMFFLVFS